MSKSVGNVVDQQNLINAFGPTRSAFPHAKASFGQDGSYSKSPSSTASTRPGKQPRQPCPACRRPRVAKNCVAKPVPNHGENSTKPTVRSSTRWLPSTSRFVQTSTSRLCNAPSSASDRPRRHQRLLAEQEPRTLRKNGEPDRMNTVLYPNLEVKRSRAPCCSPSCPTRPPSC